MDQKAFERRIDELVGRLGRELQRVHPLLLLSFLNQMEMHSIGPDAPDSVVPDGHVQKFHYIAGLVASRPVVEQEDQELSDPKGTAIRQILHLVDLLFNEYQLLWITRPSLDGSCDEAKMQEYMAGLVSFLLALSQPTLGSSEQFERWTADLFQEFDGCFFAPQLGITTGQCIAIAREVAGRVADQYQAMVDDFADTIRPVYESWRRYRDGELTFEQAICEARRTSPSDTVERLEQNKSLFVRCFVVSVDDLADRFPRPVLEAFFKLLSFRAGAVNQGFRLPTDANELDYQPFLFLGPGRYYLTEVLRLHRAVPRALERAIVGSQYAQRFYRHRDRLTQDRTVELLGQIVPAQSIVQHAYYTPQGAERCETDILIPMGRVLLICEVKAKGLRSVLHSQGNIAKIQSDFRSVVQDAYRQASRTRDYVLSQEQAVFTDEAGRELCTLRRDDIGDYHLMVVTAEQFGALATDLSILLDKDANAPYPFVVCLRDLEWLITRLDTPDRLLDYMDQRRSLHGIAFASDELDFAGYYAMYGKLDFQSRLAPGERITLAPTFSHVFDDDWYVAHGFGVDSRQQPGGPFFERLWDGWWWVGETPGSYQSAWERTQPAPGEPVPQMKGRDRNKRCPCGSGRKFKHCCGR